MRLGYPEKVIAQAICLKCFNEAEAHAPRIQFFISQYCCYVVAASMRPRRMRLGYAIIFLSVAYHILMLQ